VAKKTAANSPAVKKDMTKPASKAPAPEAGKKVHPLIKAFVVYHLIAITLYALPKPSDDVLKGKIEPRGSDALLSYNVKEMKNWAVFYGYLYPTGFWQYWDMFAPDPAQVDAWCDAEVTYLDGTKATFKYPRMKDLSIPAKYTMERYRKYYERVNVDDWPFFWPPFGQAIALKMANDPNNPPVKVAIYRHFQPVMRHDKPQSTEPPYGTYNFFTYVVDQHKLFSDKGWKLGIH
jgi:hypothetical protein